MKPATEAYEVENMLRGMDFLSSLKQPELAEMIISISTKPLAYWNIEVKPNV